VASTRAICAGSAPAASGRAAFNPLLLAPFACAERSTEPRECGRTSPIRAPISRRECAPRFKSTIDHAASKMVSHRGFPADCVGLRAVLACGSGRAQITSFSTRRLAVSRIGYNMTVADQCGSYNASLLAGSTCERPGSGDIRLRTCRLQPRAAGQAASTRGCDLPPHAHGSAVRPPGSSPKFIICSASSARPAMRNSPTNCVSDSSSPC
jgi:hypothetical protein